MNGTADFESTPDDDMDQARARIAAVREARKRNGKRGVDEIDVDLTRAWVRWKLGRNRGEDRPVHGTTGPFDALLNERLAAVGGKSSMPARGVVGG